MTKKYKPDKYKIIEYINASFNIEKTSLLLIYNIYDYLQSKNENYFIYKVNYSFSSDEFIIPSFLNDFISILNNSDIDISIIELINNRALLEV